MCGIAGFQSPNGAEGDAATRVRLMVAALRHRGPDGDGVVPVGPAAIGMCRLRIRSAPDTAVPFTFGDGAHGAYNGEVYALRRDRGAPAPDGGAGEVAVLAGEGAAEADGMYALASLDRAGALRFARDRFGIKPLFVREDGNGLTFASELPALFAASGPLDMERDAFHEMLAFGRTLDRRTLYRGIRELAPGETLAPAAPDRMTSPSAGDLQAAIRDAVGRTLLSDRPVGLALSGGLDSTIIAHELSASGVRGLRTISLSLRDNGDGVTGLGELGLGADPASATWTHTTLAMDEGGYMAALAAAARRNGEPFRMSSVPLYYALGAEAARQGITVLLLGEGADELFGGYESYRGACPDGTDPVPAIAAFYLDGANGRYLSGLIGQRAAAMLRDRLVALLWPLVAGREPKQALLAAERMLSLEPLLRRADHALMAASVEGRTPFLHGRVPDLAAALPDAELWSPDETKRALRLAYAGVLPPSVLTAPKRALRAPGRVWRDAGVPVLDALDAPARALFDALGLDRGGVTAVRDGCAAGDPAAVPFAVALISAVSCLSALAMEGRLIDPALAQAAVAARTSLLTPLTS